jgi:C1A family cysteine protease
MNMLLKSVPKLAPLPKDFSTPILAHRNEPKETAEKHWTFGAKMKPALVGAAAASDLRVFASPRHDQRRTSSCAAQAMIKALELLRIKQWGIGAHVDLSRLACYFLARELMDPPETDRDEGSYISMNAEALRRFGTCTEDQWPFDERLVLKSPPWRVMQSAYKNRIVGWTMISSSGSDRVDDVILALANGIPVAYGTKVGSDWLNYGSNSEPLGLPSDVKGRHATLLEGWDPAKGVFLGENSWGTGWGSDGFYEIRPEVIAWSDSKDFVCVTTEMEKLVNV